MNTTRLLILSKNEKMENNYCIACGNESEMPRCKPCFIENREDPTHLRERDANIGTIKVTGYEIAGGAPPKYCHSCGEDLDEERIKFAIRNGGECKYCYSCSHS